MGPEDTYTVEMKVDQGAVIVTASAEPKIVVTVSLTSPLMREPQPDTGGKYGRRATPRGTTLDDQFTVTASDDLSGV